MLVVVTIISLLVHIYSTEYVRGDRRYTHYFAFLSLFTRRRCCSSSWPRTRSSCILGWEIIGVCSFMLIGHWWEEKPNSDAALKAFLTNRVGDVGLLVGMIIIFFGRRRTSFNILEINRPRSTAASTTRCCSSARLCLFVAVIGKSGQFPLHTWLPDAMAGPTPVSALIHAATMVVAGVYLVARLYPVFFDGLHIGDGRHQPRRGHRRDHDRSSPPCWRSCRTTSRRCWPTRRSASSATWSWASASGAWTAAVFHLFTHAFFKACLFLGAGSVSHSGSTTAST